MTNPNVDFAIGLVARRVASRALTYSLYANDITHEDYPDIAASDWDRVLDIVERIIKDLNISDEDYTKSYGQLSERADTND